MLLKIFKFTIVLNIFNNINKRGLVMKQTFYIIKNNSRNEGTFFIDGDYRSIYPGEKLEFSKKPLNYTANLILSVYHKEIGDSPILNKKIPVVKSVIQNTKKTSKK